MMTDELPESLSAIPTAQKRYLTCAETAKLVRAALKETFPGQKFSVRSSVYSMGASIDVSWTDGPTAEQVDDVTNAFRGSDFDSMQDMKVYRDSRLNGERVSFGADYIHTRRDLSADLEFELIAAVQEQTGRPFDRNGDYTNDVIRWQDEFVPGGGRWGSDLIYRMSSVTSRYTKPDKRKEGHG